MYYLNKFFGAAQAHQFQIPLLHDPFGVSVEMFEFLQGQNQVLDEHMSTCTDCWWFTLSQDLPSKTPKTRTTNKSLDDHSRTMHT